MAKKAPPPSFIKTLIVGVAGTIASYYVTRYVTALLEEKPLRTRFDEAKCKITDVQVGLQGKATDVKQKAQTKVDEVLDKLENLYQGKS